MKFETYKTEHNYFEKRGNDIYRFPLTYPQINTLNKQKQVFKIFECGYNIICATINIQKLQQTLIMPNGIELFRDVENVDDIQKTINDNFICSYIVDSQISACSCAVNPKVSFTRYAMFDINGNIIKSNMLSADKNLWYTEDYTGMDFVSENKFKNEDDLQVLFNHKNVPMWIGENLKLQSLNHEFATVAYDILDKKQTKTFMAIIHKDKGLVMDKIDLSFKPTWYDKNQTQIEFSTNEKYGLIASRKGISLNINPETLKQYMELNKNLIGLKTEMNKFKTL